MTTSTMSPELVDCLESGFMEELSKMASEGAFEGLGIDVEALLKVAGPFDFLRSAGAAAKGLVQGGVQNGIPMMSLGQQLRAANPLAGMGSTFADAGRALSSRVQQGASALAGKAQQAGQAVAGAARQGSQAVGNAAQGAKSFLAGGVDPKTGLPMKGLLGNIAGEGMHTGASVPGRLMGASGVSGPSAALQQMGPKAVSSKPLFGAPGQVMTPQQAAAKVTGGMAQAPAAASPLQQTAVATPRASGPVSGGGFSRRGPSPVAPPGRGMNMFAQPSGPSPFSGQVSPVAPPQRMAALRMPTYLELVKAASLGEKALPWLARASTEHGTEVAGLGLMAAATADKMRQQHQQAQGVQPTSVMGGEKGQLGADLGGLGLMAAPTLAALRHSGNPHAAGGGNKLHNAINAVSLAALAAPTIDNLQARFRAAPGEDPESKQLMSHGVHNALELGGLAGLAVPVVRGMRGPGNSVGDHISSAATLAGLGTLAAPHADDVQSHLRAGHGQDPDSKQLLSPKARGVAELAGLGLLAAPAAAHLIHGKHASLKTAATVQQLEAGLNRVRGVVRAPQAIAGAGQYLPTVERAAKLTKANPTQRMIAEVAPDLYQESQQMMAQALRGNNNQIALPRGGSYRAMGALGIELPRVSGAGQRATNALTKAHETYERGVTPEAAQSLSSHLSPEVLWKEHNAVARLTGPGAEEGKRVMTALRESTGEAPAMNGVLSGLYGPRAAEQYGFGAANKMPKAMRKDFNRQFRTQVRVDSEPSIRDFAASYTPGQDLSGAGTTVGLMHGKHASAKDVAIGLGSSVLRPIARTAGNIHDAITNPKLRHAAMGELVGDAALTAGLVGGGYALSKKKEEGEKKEAMPNAREALLELGQALFLSVKTAADWTIPQTRSGKRSMRVSTLLKKEEEGTLGKKNDVLSGTKKEGAQESTLAAPPVSRPVGRGKRHPWEAPVREDQYVGGALGRSAEAGVVLGPGATLGDTTLL